MEYVYFSIGVLFILCVIGCLICGFQKRYAYRIVRSRTLKEKVRDLNQDLEPFGFLYDPVQDIFNTDMYAWQRNFGYCRLYDEAAAVGSMIIDCEPIYFTYDNKRWLIEFWKGQYGMCAGAEVGIYYTDYKDDGKKPEELLYQCVSDDDLLSMKFVVQRKEDALFYARDCHWWLTAFDLGEFIKPGETTLYLSINVPNANMRKAFTDGLREAGYNDKEFLLEENEVKVIFDKPKSKQPRKRRKLLSWFSQKNNKRNCRLFRQRTRIFRDTIDKIDFLRYSYPMLYRAIFRFSKMDIVKKNTPKKKGG